MEKTGSIFTYAQFVKRMTSGQGVATPDGGCQVGFALDTAIDDLAAICQLNERGANHVD